jgi:hypothetical protein
VKIRNAIVSAPMNFSIISAYKKPCVGRKHIFPCIRHMPKAILKGKTQDYIEKSKFRTSEENP